MNYAAMTIQQIEQEAYRLYNSAGRDSGKWQEVTDSFLYLLEHQSDPIKKAQYGNTLGYIYYYGRPNGFKPQYDKAYEYFIIGAKGGFFESRYKLGDMYLNGYYVAKNEAKAAQIYRAVYKDVESQFYREIFEGVFADVALRLGNLYRKGIGCPKDEKKALEIYTMADYAMKERMKESDFFGNRKVMESIARELSELQEMFHVDPSKREIVSKYPIALPKVLGEERRANIYIIVERDEIVLEEERITAGNGEDNPYIPVIFPEYAYLEFLDEVTETAVGVTTFEFFEQKDGWICVDEIGYDEGLDRHEFYLDGKLVGYIKAKEFRFGLERG